MNAVEIEEALSALASAPFDPVDFAYAFLQSFGIKETTIIRLRRGETNGSDVGGVLQRNNIHIAIAEPGAVSSKLLALRDSPKTASAKAKFILATDGETLEAEDLASGEPLATIYSEFADHFGFFLPLAGISTTKEIKNNPIDVKATGRLNRLYVELLKINPDWGTPERRHDLNQFMARLIFCFFAEDTGIFNGTNLFTATIERMSTTEAGSVEHVLTELFRAMDIKPEDRAAAELRSWADVFPYVNGGLFAGGKPCPSFSKIARSYLLRAGELNWKEINPDIFGSMIQAVADDNERSSLGQHYTSVPNIMKVLGPLFLDDLRVQLEAAGDNVRKLRNLRKRMANIRVFDPACGSGNFLVIAYIRMREIEHEIVKRTDDEPKSAIPLANFYGIEIKDFAAEIARLALLIAEFQCDVRFISQQVARSLVLPLKRTGQIKTGNALVEDWLKVCPPHYFAIEEIDLAGPTGRLNIDEEAAYETYLCGNPPYVGDKKQNKSQKEELRHIFESVSSRWRSFDYVCGFFFKAFLFIDKTTNASSAFVSTNSITQGGQVAAFWPLVLGQISISFAVSSFKWANLAAHNAGVTCVVIGLSNRSGRKMLYDGSQVRQVEEITPYMTAGRTVLVEARAEPLSDVSAMLLGNFSKDGGALICEQHELRNLDPVALKFVRPMFGGQEFIKGIVRYCFWIKEDDLSEAARSDELQRRFTQVALNREASPKKETVNWAKKPYRFVEIRSPSYKRAMVIPIVSSENRSHLPVGPLPEKAIVNYAFGMYDAPIWNMAIIASRLHLVWIATVCGKMKTDFRYSNTLGWNTFPLPQMTDNDKKELTHAAQAILLAREEQFPATIADMYDPDNMAPNLRRAHEINDEAIERIYIGRCFRNDTERLEKLFELYTKMTAAEAKGGKKPMAQGRRHAAAGAA